MKKAEITALARGLAQALRALGLQARLAVLEARALVPGPPGDVGPTGPAGAPGLAGRDGRDGAAGKDGERGTDGHAGQDGAAGRDGTDGLDGFGFDGLEVVHDGERGFSLRFTKGTRVREFPFTLPFPLYRGVYQAGHDYARGDCVTFGGSQWIAREPTTAKPGDGATAWQLAVKAGRDGKEGKEGKGGPPGPRGESAHGGRGLP